MNILDELISLLRLEKIEENIYRGQSYDLGFDGVYGGQVLGQALAAATRTVPPERKAHSLHAYFLRPGDATRPIVYEVDPIRNGLSFSTRRVKAVQKGRAIFNMSASFHVVEPGFDHQSRAPRVPGPEGLAPDVEIYRNIAHRFPEPARTKFLCPQPIEVRQVEPMNPFEPEKRDPVRYLWFRAIGRMPDDLSIHQYLLAYASDYGLVITSLYPHGQSYWQPDMRVASLDHAMWFHRDFRMDDWLLHEMTSPSAFRARGMAEGKIYSRDGKLVASVTQEGLIRRKSSRHRR